MKRSAPSGGYDFGNKRQYRRTIWKRFREHCGTARSTVQCLLMPSIEGHEIEVAMANGFREANLHVVDRNAAIVAHLKRRFPQIHTYGVELSEACRRMCREGVPIGVANFDLCSNIGSGPMKSLARVGVGLRGICGPDTLVAVSILRGRETKWAFQHAFSKTQLSRPTFHLFSHLQDGDVTRCQSAAVALTCGMVRAEKAAGLANSCVLMPKSERDAGIYRSVAGSQTMLWCILQCYFLREPREVDLLCDPIRSTV